MVELHKVDNSNIWKVVKLSVKEEQKGFVADNAVSILQAYALTASGKIALPFGICKEGCLVGFVMLGYDTTGEGEEPSIATKNYCLWRFMIDQNFQGEGIGKEALEAILNYVKTEPCGKATYCWLSYEPENVVAKHLYLSMGFQETGEKCGNELIATLKL